MDNLTEGLRKVFLAGVGAVALTAEKTGELLDEMIEKGEQTVDQGKALNKELKHTILDSKDKKEEKKEEKKPDLDNLVQKLSTDELAKLKDLIAKAENKE